MTLAYRLYSPPFRRTVTLQCAPGQVVSRVSDNVHDFKVTLWHDGAQVTDVVGDAIRVPWTTCPIATERLKSLVGTSVKADARVTVDQTQQCTHMLDLAKLAIAHIRRGGDRSYEITIEAKPDPAACHAKISRDGEQLFEWHVVKDLVVEPPPFSGHVTTGRALWTREVDADCELREAALIVRRCLIVFRGRRRITPNAFRASSLPELAGVCTSFQPDLVKDAVRPPNFVDLE